MTGYRIINLVTNDTYDTQLNTSLRPANLLQVPYCSQMGPGADANGNDCGAASGLMVLKAYKPGTTMTVDDFYAEANPGGHNDPLWVGQIRSALGAHGIATDYKVLFDDATLFGCLRARKPVIALIKYARLQQNGLTQPGIVFSGAHFVVIVGMDLCTIYVSDPLYTACKGDACAYPIDIFWQAWADAVQDNNPDRAGIIPTVGIGQVIPPDPQALYSIKITCNAQNIRSGPGENFDPPVELYYMNRIAPVYEERGKWGRVGFNKWIFLGTPYNRKV